MWLNRYSALVYFTTFTMSKAFASQMDPDTAYVLQGCMLTTALACVCMGQPELALWAMTVLCGVELNENHRWLGCHRAHQALQ